MRKSPVIPGSPASLKAEVRACYEPLIDDILAKHGNEVISCDRILDTLPDRVDVFVVPHDRPLIKTLIIERLRRHPTPTTVARPNCVDPGISLLVTSTATTTTLNVPELLESILSYLDMVDLVYCGRVNKAFYRHICASATLQRKLFLLPCNDELQYWRADWDDETHTTSASIASSEGNVSPDSGTEDSSMEASVVVTMNPLLTKYNVFSSENVADNIHLEVTAAANLDKHLSRSSIWPRMYVTQPSSKCAYISIVYSILGPEEYRPSLYVSRAVYDPAGVTFATLQDAANEVGEIRSFKQFDNPWSYYPLKTWNTSAHEQIEHFKCRGVTISLDKSVLQFCAVATPSEAEFEEMKLNGCVKGKPCPVT